MTAATGVRIPFNRATFAGPELDYISRAVAAGHISGDGPFTRACHALLEEIVGTRRALLTTSCTHALEMAALLLDVRPGDEVIVPSFTFVSCVNAFVLRGAIPVFADIRMDTLNIDESHVDELITPRTIAIVVVHYAGVACDMDRIGGIAARAGLAVIEDNAHGLFGSWRGQKLGTFGRLATLSFHETKNITCGEGGALLVNDPGLVERAEIIREKGTNRSRFFRGQVDKYTWVDVGSSYLPSEVLAAFLLAQLEHRDDVQAARRRVWETYASGLGRWAAAHDVRLPVVPSQCEQSYHLFYLLMPTLEARQALIASLRTVGIMAVFHYLPLHLSEMGVRYGGKPGLCPVTESVSDRLIRLPLFTGLTPAEQDEVIDAVCAFAAPQESVDG